VETVRGHGRIHGFTFGSCLSAIAVDRGVVSSHRIINSLSIPILEAFAYFMVNCNSMSDCLKPSESVRSKVANVCSCVAIHHLLTFVALAQREVANGGGMCVFVYSPWCGSKMGIFSTRAAS